MRKLIVFLLLIVSFLIFSNALYFENATIYYENGYENLAIRIGNIFENIRDDVINMFKNDPGRVNIFIKPKTTITNGYANPLQKNTIVIYTWHPTGINYNFLPLDDWYKYLLIHEFTHIVTLKPSDGILKTLSDFNMPYIPTLGKLSFEAPTVFSESQFSENSGRLRSPIISEALFSTFGGAFPNDSLANDFRVGLVTYNGQGGFFEYLVNKYGIEKVNKYLKDSMQKSYSWLEIMLNISLPYIYLMRVPQFFQDDFRAHFGNNYEDEVSEWLKSINVKFGNEKLYDGKNERIYKIEVEEDKFYILKSKFGAVPGYLDTPINELTILKDNKVIKTYQLSAVDFKVKNGKIYALLNFNNKMEVWEITENKKLLEGFISAFDVNNETIIYSIYNDKEDESIIYGLEKEIKINGFVRSIAFNGKNLYYLIGNSLYKDGELIDDYFLKGAFLKKSGNNIYLTIKVNEHMELIDVESFKLLTNNLYAFDGLVFNNQIYYISYTQNGMAVYLEKNILNEDLERNILKKSYEEKHDFKTADFWQEKSYSLTTSIFAPFFLTSAVLPDLEIGDGWIVGSIFDFKPFTETDLFLIPYYLHYSKLYYPDTGQPYYIQYNNYGLAHALVWLEDSFNILEAGLLENRENELFYTGYTQIDAFLFKKKIGYNKNLYFNFSMSGLYSLDSTNLKYDFSIVPSLGFSANKNGIGLYAVSKFEYDQKFSISSVGINFIKIFDDISYMYSNLDYLFNDSNDFKYSILYISNVFPFYKQSGVGLGIMGDDFVINGLFYVYFGLPNTNQIYIQSGFKMDMEMNIELFVSIGESPHNFSVLELSW